VLDLCKHFEVNHYLSGALGADYLVEEDFTRAGITIEYQKFQPPTYPQLWKEFIPGLSILDWWMNGAELPAFGEK